MIRNSQLMDEANPLSLTAFFILLLCLLHPCVSHAPCLLPLLPYPGPALCPSGRPTPLPLLHFTRLFYFSLCLHYWRSAIYNMPAFDSATRLPSIRHGPWWFRTPSGPTWPVPPSPSR
ncbi:hypothetical protein IWX91DRAFT_335415 [Phyllosticta citricarpa]